MKIAVFGSTSSTGLQVLEKAINRRHEITAFTRREQKLATVQGLKKVIQGNGLNSSDVQQAIAGQEAVLAIVGSDNKKGVTETTDVIRNIIRGMENEKVSRLLFVSSYLIDGKRPRITISMIRWFIRHTLSDIKSAEQLIASSQTEWTIVRPTQLTNKPETNQVRITKAGTDFNSSPYEISRLDLANVLLDLLEQKKEVNSIINVTAG
ncbi:NAD(P)-dependent oxidoreductase [Evansella halocellulosilytica]|uniref:NAD(P)-dependent oxidoreductase n=1 Tax=Evansella halocellulosilytica TaxID=2011013 RepID=UPI000BB87D0D|nr:NAD(P)-binding oxidoreductase [Evansella halocellulosilytica]